MVNWKPSSINSQELQLTLCINTPFDFEGSNKVWRARNIIQSLENKKFKHIIFNNEDLFKMAGRETTYEKAFEAMDHKILDSIFDRMKKIYNS